ncbi:hypothetical protein BCR36DRAFT_343993 [Piromyces finnis]|uniref:Uncharacterized protein n=1 Tax=Piromyces finnis TaxID=1754191 RepID=A0A1Y1VLE5_9FUNG|nr:hypothetical protein BCR36DRAFT_343993 [Piromyces finnis]|eukprot:ORX58579.1 hypothetical protein BCR36DRAFT_343993 [Piromyces finnis]
MEIKSWKECSSPFSTSYENLNYVDDKEHKNYYQNKIDDTDNSELIETRIPPKAASPFIPLESLNHSLFNSASENYSNFNNNNVSYNNIVDSNVINENNINTNNAFNLKTQKSKKKSVIFKDEVDEFLNDETSFSLTLERNFNKNFSGNTKYESILQSSPPSLFNSGFNSYDPSPISYNINESGSEKPILLNNISPTPARKPSILKTSIHYHKKIDNTNPKISNLSFENIADQSHFKITIDDNSNENNNNNTNVLYFDKPEVNTFYNNDSNDNNYKSSNNNISDNKNNADPNKDNIDETIDNSNLINNNDTMVDSSFSDIPIETLKDYNSDENDIIEEFATTNTSTNIINDMKFKNDTTESPFISSLSFNNLSWNDNSSFISISRNNHHPYTKNSVNNKSPNGLFQKPLMKYKFNESSTATSQISNHKSHPDNNNLYNSSPKHRSPSSPRKIKNHIPINHIKISTENSNNSNKKDHHDYDNFLESSSSNLPYFYKKNVKFYQDVNGPYPQEEQNDNFSESRRRSQSPIRPIKHIQYPSNNYNYKNENNFVGEKTSTGLAIHQGLQLSSKQSLIQKTKPKLSDRYWKQLEMKSGNFYNIRKKQRENRFKKIITKKIVNSLPIAKKVDKKNQEKLINNFEKLTMKHVPEAKENEILIVDPRIVEKLNDKPNSSLAQNELKKYEINKISNKSLEIKALPSSYILESLDNNANKKLDHSYTLDNLNIKKKKISQSSSLPVLVNKADRKDRSNDNPLQQNPPPHPHSPPPKPPSLLHENFNFDHDFSYNNNKENDFYNDNQSEREEENDSIVSYSSNYNIINFNGDNKHFKKSFSEPYLQYKYNTKKNILENPTLNSTNGYIKKNWYNLCENKANFEQLAKQIKDGVNDSSSTGRKTFIDQIIKENTKKKEYYYKNYLTETFGEDRQHLIQNHLDQYKHKLNQELNNNEFSVNGIKININKNGDINTSQTKKAVKNISNRVANKVTTVHNSETQYKNLVSLQDPIELPQDKNIKVVSGTSYIPRAKKVINKNWLASLEIKPPTIEEINGIGENNEVEFITETSLKLKDNPLEKPYFSDYITEDGHTFLQENNPDHPVPSYSSLLLNLMNAKQFMRNQQSKVLDISEIVTFSESIPNFVQKSYFKNK